MAKRTPISKKRRFDIFKRDSFTCQYCGSAPPKVILHVDHIRPVKDGGDNSTDNLITSCSLCNLGKGAASLKAIPQSLKDKASYIKEQEAQILGYSKIIEDRKRRIDAEVWNVIGVMGQEYLDNGIRRDWYQSTKQFIERIGYHETLEAIEIAMAKHPSGTRRTFLYFCGICWNKIRGENR